MGFSKTIGLFFLGFWLFSLDIVAKSTEPQYWVIGNNTGYTSISKGQLREVFTGGVVLFPSKKPVTVVLHSSSTKECQMIADFYFKGSVPGMQKFWLSQVFQGRSNPPVFLASHADIVKYIEQNEGAIAIVFSKEGLDKWLIPIELP